ncbi:MAG: hypothetical protein ACK5LS_11150 [Propioniciclava sp.]
MSMPLLTAIADFVALIPMQIPDPDPVQPPGTEGITSILGWAK